MAQSPKLAALLTLSIGPSHAPQCSIVMEELPVHENGIMAWAKLLQHFERSTKDLRLDALLQQWENDTLQAGEQPDELYTRLAGTNAKLKTLGADFEQAVFTRRFVAAIGKQQGHLYNGVLQQYRGMMIRGNPYTLDELREFLAYVHATTEKVTDLGAAMKCGFCAKEGHEERECWTKNPGLKSGHRETAKHPRDNKKYQTRPAIRCYKCGENCHMKRDCKKSSTGYTDSNDGDEKRKKNGERRAYNGGLWMHGSSSEGYKPYGPW